MNRREGLKKLTVVGLAVVCVVLVFNVISDINKSSAESSRPSEPAVQPVRHLKKIPIKGGGELKNIDPNLQVDTLKEYLAKPLPENTRNPFDFAAVPIAPTAAGHSPGAAGSLGAAGGPAIPPKPQVSIQVIGYAEKAGIGGEAYLADEDQVFVVHKGDVVEKRYTILRIFPTQVEILDNASGETAQLPIPTAQ